MTDPSKKLGEYEDVSKVEKFEISEDEYSKRTDSVRYDNSSSFLLECRGTQ